MVRGQSEGLQLDESYFLLANNKNFAIDEEGAKNKTSRPKRRQQRQTKKVQKTSLLKEFQHRLKTKHRPSKLRRHCSHKMRREPIVSSLEKLQLQGHLLTHSRTSVIMMRATNLLTEIQKKEMTMKQEKEI